MITNNIVRLIIISSSSVVLGDVCQVLHVEFAVGCAAAKLCKFCTFGIWQSGVPRTGDLGGERKKEK